MDIVRTPTPETGNPDPDIDCLAIGDEGEGQGSSIDSEDEEMNKMLEILDPEYAARREEASKDRETLRASALLQVRQAGADNIEVSGAGSDEFNGVYLASYIWSYRGPTMYQKPNSRHFIFRWQQRHWVIAHLSHSDAFRDKSTWYYKAPSQGWTCQCQTTGVQSPEAAGCFRAHLCGSRRRGRHHLRRPTRMLTWPKRLPPTVWACSFRRHPGAWRRPTVVRGALSCEWTNGDGWRCAKRGWHGDHQYFKETEGGRGH